MIVQAKHYELGVYKNLGVVNKHDIQTQSGWKAKQLHMCIPYICTVVIKDMDMQPYHVRVYRV